MRIMAEVERYNGWANRETWALNLWLGNDQGLYGMTRERVAEALRGLDYPSWVNDDAARDRFRAGKAGDAIKDMWEELTDPDEKLIEPEAIITMVRDVGSDYRVDWYEIGASWVEDVADLLEQDDEEEGEGED